MSPSPATLLLKAYYERLHERMTAARARCVERIDVVLAAEVQARDFGPMPTDKIQAYRDAAIAFIDERLEAYNPIGIQYTFDCATSRRAVELEFQLNWYESREEFEQLVAAARELTSEAPSDAKLPELADELIRRAGAFPDRSITAAYEAKPTLQGLPDFVVARVLEEIICGADAQ